MNQVKSNTAKYSLLKDIGLLVKVKLSITVLLSSVLSFVIFSDSNFNWYSFLFLLLGGALVTFAANALNQVIERDYDKLMIRTALRPIPDGRMNISFAVLLSGIFCTIGVPVGAIPGALPILIGSVAAQGYISTEAFCLFGIQYLWQFPHFWAIAWMGHEDYSKAGFKLIKDLDGKPDPLFGIYSAVYAALSICFVYLFYSSSSIALPILILLSILIGIYTYLGYLLYKQNDRFSARKLFFYSIAYLPLVLLLFTLNKIL